MGDGADDLELRGLNLEWQLEGLINEIHSGYWRTGDGKSIHIKRLADSHLDNIINMLNDNETMHTRWLPTLYAEQRRRFKEGEEE